MNDEVREGWERFLTPAVLRTNLTIASLYIATFEILKNTIIERIQDFYTTGFDQNGLIVDPKYQNEVLSKNRSPVHASIQWLKERHAISDNDITIFREVKKYRNTLTHELTRILTEGLPADISDRFHDMVSLLDKIERWWIIEVEIPTDPDLVGKEIDEEGIIPGTIASLKMMVDIALGSDEEAEYYIKKFIESGLLGADTIPA